MAKNPIVGIHDGVRLVVQPLSRHEDLSSNSALLRVQRRVPNEYNHEPVMEVPLDAGPDNTLSGDFLVWGKTPSRAKKNANWGVFPANAKRREFDANWGGATRKRDKEREFDAN